MKKGTICRTLSKVWLSIALCLIMLLNFALIVEAVGVPSEVMDAVDSVIYIESGGGHGTGFVIKNENKEVLIATNNHVVEGNFDDIFVWLSNEKRIKAEVVFTVAEKDLSVIRIRENAKIKAVLLSPNNAQRGDAVYAVGFPGAGDVLSDTQAHTSESATITDGIVSAVRSFTVEKGSAPVELLQVNAAINSGNSGGPLFNTEGMVVGINTYKVNTDSQGIFGAVAVSELWDVLEEHDIDIPSAEKETVVPAVPVAAASAVQPRRTMNPLVIGCIVVCAALLFYSLYLNNRNRKAWDTQEENIDEEKCGDFFVNPISSEDIEISTTINKNNGKKTDTNQQSGDYFKGVRL